MYFKQFFTFLEKAVFTKKGVLLQVRSIFTEEYPCGSFAWMFPCKVSKYS